MTASGEEVRVVRAASGPPDGARWVLTGLDRANLILTIRGRWLFRAALDVGLLEEGLGALLGLYPHLAGRMERGEAVALCNAGVPLTVGHAPEATVESAGAAAASGRALAARLDRKAVSRGRAAPMAVRVTRLADGCALGVSCSHGCLDGVGFYRMVETWSRICRGAPVEPPLLDQTLVPSGLGLSKAETRREALAAGWRAVRLWRLAAVLPALVGGRLLERSRPLWLPPEEIDRLKREAGVEGTHVALAAHLTRASVALHRLADGTRCEQVTVVDGRGRLPGVPASFAGNVPFVVAVEARAGEPLPAVADRIRRGLEPFTASPSAALARQIALGQDVARHRLLVLPYDVTAMHCRRPTTFYVNNFSRLPIYDLDFGGGARPVRAVPHDLPDPLLVWPAPPERGGVEVYLTGVAARALARLAVDDPARTALEPRLTR